jgi:integrase
LDSGKVRVRKGKGGKARTVALDPEALGVVQAWLERKASMKIGGPIFSTLHGEPLLAAYVRNLFKRLGKKAHIAKRVHPHGLRHTFASGLADEKVDIRIIQRALGHSSLNTTARYVDHLNPTAVIDALKARAW